MRTIEVEEQDDQRSRRPSPVRVRIEAHRTVQGQVEESLSLITEGRVSHCDAGEILMNGV